MSYDKITTLIERLAKKTARGEIDWEETSYRNGFQVAFPGYTVVVSFEVQYVERHSGEAECVIISIYNDQGELVEQVSDEDVRGKIQNAFSLMKEIYDGARRRAMGVEQALDSILAELPDDSVSP